MTTEIAVANRLGIALATDSAVTITGGGRVKVFDTADKLFEISDVHPVAVMINGNMDCLGVPWEILAKEFREKEGSDIRLTVAEWGEDLLRYVECHALISETKIGGFVDNVTLSEIDLIQSDVMAQLYHHTVDGLGAIKKRRFDLGEVLAEVIDARRQEVESKPVAQSLEGIDPDKIREAYAARIQSLIENKFSGQKLTQAEVSGMASLVVQALLRDVESDFRAGVVVAGYGSDQTFPSVFSAEVDGRVLGKLKITKQEVTSIKDSEEGGLVTFFAQTDVIERLLKGVDPKFVEKTTEFIQATVSNVARRIERAARRRKMSKRRIAEREALIDDIAKAAAAQFSDAYSKDVKDGFSRNFDSMIAMMPKAELIELAEALVSITAVERKATADEGTVGGPIDVGFITKHEGFVWIKRKHYFERDKNPRYFWRKYGNPPGKGEAS